MSASSRDHRAASPASPAPSEEAPGLAPLRRPAELDELDLARSAVIEASAGTGKTYLLEHLVLELLITGRARLEEILIVTFTERATAELVGRIRDKIDHALFASASASASASARGQVVGWTLDEAARARLADARRSFDQATIATIHSFCQGILTDEPLATGRLLGQTQVDGRQAFGEVFRDVLRRDLARGDSQPAYLDAYLATGRGADDLEELLYRAATARGEWARTYDESALRAVAEQLVSLKLDGTDLEKALRRHLHHSSVTALLKRLRRLAPEVAAALASRAWGRLLACFDVEADVFGYFDTIAGLPDGPGAILPVLVPLHRFAVAALDAVPPLDEAVAQRFLPLVQARLRQRKLAEGLYDYDDMIRAVDDAIAGPLGPALVDKLRRRYRFALVDEAQDTELAQWRIFRRVFLDSDGPNPVVLIGDPKQAIYGFRGADVHTYVQARQDIRDRGGAILQLSRNQRSHPEVVAAYNSILDHAATPRYFTGDTITYDHPVTAVKPALGTGPGVTLLTAEVSGDRASAARVGAVRKAHRDAIAVEISRLSGMSGVSLSEIFVLARSNAEAREIAARLHQEGIPNVLFKPDDIFKSPEATHIRALLQAIVDPDDRAARLSAWLTPFFDVTLDELAGCADPPPDHPLMARLAAWKTLGDAHAYDDLWARILDDSGVARRLRLSAAGLRRLTNYRHLFDLLHVTAAARPTSVGDLAALLGAFAAGQRRPGGPDDDTQRLETEGDAVRVMTIHAAKGLEADVVFIYGGLTGNRFWRGVVHTLPRQRDGAEGSPRAAGAPPGGVRLLAGRPRRQEHIDLIEAARQEEEQRLLYVAMTRVRKHLYLPFFPSLPAVESGEGDGSNERGAGDFDPFRKISGEYRHINQRLRALALEPGATSLFRRQSLAGAESTQASEAVALAGVAAWTPPDSEAGTANPTRTSDPEMDDANDGAARLRAQRRGFVITSYSRLSDAEGVYRPPLAENPQPAGPGAAADPTPPSDGGAPRVVLPGGLASGLFLHAILENVALGELPPLALWREQPEVRHLIEREARHHDRGAEHFGEAARLVHAALTTTIPMPDGSLVPGIARAARVRREVDFLFPLPRAATEDSTFAEDRFVHERGFVRGALDVLFEHQGRVCFADWKSNILPHYSSELVQEHVADNYQLQMQIYTLAVVRLLGIGAGDRSRYDTRFGGLVYLFLRGLGGAATRGSTDGIFVYRPDYADVARWERDLGARFIPGAGGVGARADGELDAEVGADTDVDLGEGGPWV